MEGGEATPAEAAAPEAAAPAQEVDSTLTFEEYMQTKYKEQRAALEEIQTKAAAAVKNTPSADQIAAEFKGMKVYKKVETVRQGPVWLFLWVKDRVSPLLFSSHLCIHPPLLTL